MEQKWREKINLSYAVITVLNEYSLGQKDRDFVIGKLGLFIRVFRLGSNKTILTIVTTS